MVAGPSGDPGSRVAESEVAALSRALAAIRAHRAASVGQLAQLPTGAVAAEARLRALIDQQDVQVARLERQLTMRAALDRLAVAQWPTGAVRIDTGRRLVLLGVVLFVLVALAASCGFACRAQNDPKLL